MTTPAASSVLILGASSDMGRAIAHRYAREGWSIILAGRQSERLAVEAENLRLQHRGSVTLTEFDILDFDGHAGYVDRLKGLPGTVICVVGLMKNQQAAQSSSADTRLTIDSNFTGPALVLGEFANRMAMRGSGTIIGISSVAGDRGRASNYLYGSAKAGFTAFLSGLRNRLAKQGVAVITVKPGFCRTKMTAGMALPKRLTAEPEQVAEAIFQAEQKGHDIIYVLPIWGLIMMIIRSIPERIFKKLSI